VIDWTMLAAVAWILGAIAALASLMVRQANAVRALGALTKVSEKASRAAQAFVGPAVVGVLKPQIVLPADFEALYEPVEQKVVLAHEEEHVRGRHTLVKTLVEVAVCLNWFNPLAYLASRAIAMDQELACDEAVAARYPGDRRAYASALLKAQAGMRAPLGCYWPATSAEQLKERISRLKLSTPSAKRRIAGMGLMAVLAAASALSAWAVRPPQEQVNIIPAHADPAQANTARTAAPLADQPAPAPEPQQSPQQTQQPTVYTKPIWSERIVAQERAIAPARPRSPVLRKNVPAGFDPFDPLYVRGKVERIEFTDTRYTVFLRASSLAAGSGYPARADTSLWKLPPTPYWGDRDAVTKDLANRSIHVSGFNALDKSCAPACSLHVTLLIVPGSTALPPISQTPNFGFNDFVTYYAPPSGFADYGGGAAQMRGWTIYGVVTRIEFGDRMFDAYVQEESVGPVPGALFQVRSEYRFPRADIEKQLVGKTVAVAGWAVKMLPGKPVNQVVPRACDTVCGIYGSDFTLADGPKLTPAGATLVTDAAAIDSIGVPVVTPDAAHRLANYDYGAPLTLTGVVTKVEGTDMGRFYDNKLWVRVSDMAPAGTPGGTAGRVWVIDGWRQVLSGPGTFEAYVGRTVEITGFNARDKSCKPDCIMAGEQITIKD
jgi:hypothetical protein